MRGGGGGERSSSDLKKYEPGHRAALSHLIDDFSLLARSVRASQGLLQHWCVRHHQDVQEPEGRRLCV